MNLRARITIKLYDADGPPEGESLVVYQCERGIGADDMEARRANLERFACQVSEASIRQLESRKVSDA